ncbi:DUF3575 domain-containing protein [Bacteroides sp.]|uniref:DUF3575 domain-containing protein n=1 Tax=Bacteroides sp. TaxID=29523 RepID=UPI002616864A|nr:DUF3575 domain-containing protein [Bacteroides sp.]MDD3038688.1 DUF3575 domain-containing protein [Bacteroides sp.]
MKRIAFLCTCYLLLALPIHGEVKDSVSVSDEIILSFRINSSKIDSTYLDNKEKLEAIRTRLHQLINDSCIWIDSIKIETTASPDGPYGTNFNLSKNRSETIKKYLLAQFPAVNRCPIHFCQKVENWEGLMEAVIADTAVPARAQVLALLNNTSLSLNSKKEELKRIGEEKAYSYLVNHILPYLRNATVYIKWYIKEAPAETLPQPQATPVSTDTCTLPVTTTDVITPISQELMPTVVKSRPFPFNLRANLLSWATLSVNGGIEIPFAKRWSALFEAGWTHWNWKDGQRRYRYRSLWPEVRYHFAANNTGTRFWYMGLYLAEGQYNRHLTGSDGRQGHFFGAGLSGGYLLPLNHRLSLDLGICAGYTGDHYHIYRYQTDRDIRIRTDNGNHFGLTKVRVSLVWKFNQ